MSPTRRAENEESRQPEQSNSQRPPTPQLVDPSASDVLLGRGKSNYGHPGNQIYEALVHQNCEKYHNATSRQEQVHITQNVVVEVRNSGGWFLRYDENQRGWVRIDEKTARKKVAQAIQYLRRRNRKDGASETLGRASLPSQQHNQRDHLSHSNQLVPENTTLAFASGSTNYNLHSESMDKSDKELLSDEQIYQALGISMEPSHAGDYAENRRRYKDDASESGSCNNEESND